VQLFASLSRLGVEEAAALVEGLLALTPQKDAQAPQTTG